MQHCGKTKMSKVKLQISYHCNVLDIWVHNAHVSGPALARSSCMLDGICPISKVFVNCYYPSDAKAGGFQSQGAEGDAVVLYCNPLATLDLESSRFPERVET